MEEVFPITAAELGDSSLLGPGPPSQQAIADMTDRIVASLYERETLLRNIAQFLKVCGGGSIRCQSCGAKIWFFKSTAHKAVPYTAALLCHFADCPKADAHRKPRKEKANA